MLEYYGYKDNMRPLIHNKFGYTDYKYSSDFLNKLFFKIPLEIDENMSILLFNHAYIHSCIYIMIWIYDYTVVKKYASKTLAYFALCMSDF